MIKHNKWVGLASIGTILILILLQWGSRWLERESIISISMTNDMGWVIIVFSTVTISAILFYELARGKYYGKTLTPDLLPDGEFWIQRVSHGSCLYQIWKDQGLNDGRVINDSGEQKFFPETAPAQIEIHAYISTEYAKTKKHNGEVEVTTTRVIDTIWNKEQTKQIVIVK